MFLTKGVSLWNAWCWRRGNARLLKSPQRRAFLRKRKKMLDIIGSMKKVLIIGNSGAGKTFLGDLVAEYTGLHLVQLDEILLDPTEFHERDTKGKREEIQKILSRGDWIVEGIFGELANEFMPYCDLLIWIDLPWADCYEGLVQRGAEPLPGESREAALERFEELFEWAAQYWYRRDWSSYYGHERLYRRCLNAKIRIRERNEVNRMLQVTSGVKDPSINNFTF